MGLIPPPGRIEGGEILYHGDDLLKKSNKEMLKIRGEEISLIFQEPMTSLNPVFSVGFQISESLKYHHNAKKSEARKRAVELFAMVGIPSPEKVAGDYPHQLSGGMRQRVMIAMALACKPKILIADEPTTALDVTIQAQILRLLNQLKEQTGTSIILITHDLGIVAQTAQRVLVMYAGEAVEYTDVHSIFKIPGIRIRSVCRQLCRNSRKSRDACTALREAFRESANIRPDAAFLPGVNMLWSFVKSRSPR